MHGRYELPIYITENGLAVRDQLYLDGSIHDVQRVDYLQRALLRLGDALREGVPVRGYFHWSTMDNVEWFMGMLPRFGLYRVESKTLKRTPKLSAHWFREMARSNAVV